jgi:hypothetical protein
MALPFLVQTTPLNHTRTCHKHHISQIPDTHPSTSNYESYVMGIYLQKYHKSSPNNVLYIQISQVYCPLP